MSKNRLGPYSLGLIWTMVLFSFVIINPAFAEVSNIQTNSESFFRGEEIQFSGTVEQGSQGLVTIVIYDTLEEFVMITQALINPDNTFDKKITIGDKFSQHGIHEATGFILNMTQGATTEFGVSMNGYPINLNEKEKEEPVTSNVPSNKVSPNPTQVQSEILFMADFVDSSKGAQYYIDRYYGEPEYKSWFDRNYPGITIEQAVNGVTLSEIEKIQPLTKEPAPFTAIAQQSSFPTQAITIDFVDSSKGAQYYIDRYYGEPEYKSWFDRNYPGITIEQAVNGIVSETSKQSEIETEGDKEVEILPRTDEPVSGIIENEIIPEVEASTSNDLLSEPRQEQRNNSDIAEISLAVAGLGILFGAVYGIKRKVDDNSRQISINRDILRKKIIQPLIGSNPKAILQTRLAKGEITLEEYEQLKSKLG